MKEVIELLVSKFETVKDNCKTIIGTLSEDKNLTWIKASAKDNIVLTLSRALTDAELSKYESTLDSSEFKLYYASNMYDNGNPKLSTKGNPLSPTLTICDNNGDYLNDTVTWSVLYWSFTPSPRNLAPAPPLVVFVS